MCFLAGLILNPQYYLYLSAFTKRPDGDVELNKSRLSQKKSSPQIVSVFTTALQEKLVNSDVHKL